MKPALSLLCLSTLLTACATTSGASHQSPDPVRTEYLERPINRAMFEDHGVPDVGGLTTLDTQTPAAVQVVQLGAALKDYRCRLNAAGVALIPDLPRLPGCEEPSPVAAPPATR